MTTKTERAQNYVLSHLHHNGKRYHDLNTNDHYEVRLLGDGFGRSNDPDLIWDWSHIRDSSDEAYSEMATALRKKVRQKNKDNKEKAEIAARAAKKAQENEALRLQIQREVASEMAFNLAATFGPGTKVVNVLTGRTFHT